jgi:PAS domain S-box-containing protein
MKRISARWRIAFGQVALLVSVLMLAVALGLVPNLRETILDARARLCESIAVSSSILATRGDVTGLQAQLQAVAGRNPQILSAAVRDADGKLVAVVGEHETAWRRSNSREAIDAHVYVPIFAKDKRWGTVEVRFAPIAGSGGMLSVFVHPSVRLVLFVSLACFLLYAAYLKKMLVHLDPAKAVPGRVRSALDTLAEGLIVLDNQQRIVLVNHALANLLNANPDDLLGRSVKTLPWVNAPAADADQPWQRALREGETQRNAMLQLTDAAGVIRSFFANCSPVLGQDGKYRGVLVSLEDVTQLEAQKLELHKSKEAAEAANQAKSEFLARMSHEIRTPMNAILGFADILRRGYEENESERREYLETIHASGQHLLELINDILDLSKIESGHMQIERTTCSPHEIISEVVTVLNVRARQKGIRLGYGWDGPLPATINSDPTRLRQVLTNLVGNAIKFTERGAVLITARLIADSENPKLAIDVKDTGIGISAEGLSNLFQPFHQADTSITRRFGGTGLGLAISRQLAQAMGGDITVESIPGSGSVFTITVATGALDQVEILDQPPAHADYETRENERVRLPALRVLSVEDGESNQKLISIVLNRAGVAFVDSAGNGKAALDLATSRQYDVILMDMQMPVMDGYTAAAELRRRGITTPIVALTAHAMKGEDAKCRAAGCTAYVPKPIEVDALLRTVAEVTGSSMTHAAAPQHPKNSADEAPTGLFDRSALRSTLPIDDPDFREVVVEFSHRLQEQLGAMQRAWEERELAQLASLAHWLKGSGGSAGFNAFTEPARKLEELAHQARLDEIGRAIAELSELASHVEVPGEQGKSEISNLKSQPAEESAAEVVDN